MIILVNYGTDRPRYAYHKTSHTWWWSRRPGPNWWPW